MINKIKNVIKVLLIRMKAYGYIHTKYRKMLNKYWLKKYPDRRKQIISEYSESFKCLNVGGGKFLLKDWRILDYNSDDYKNDLLDYNIDLLECNSWPIENSSFDLVYSSHCIEHLTDFAGEKVFSEIYRILKPKGIFRLTLPDIDPAYEAFKMKNMSFFEANSNPPDKTNVYTYFLGYFSSIKHEDTNLSQFDIDYNSLSKEEFLNKYIAKDVNKNTHKYIYHLTWYNFSKIERIGKEVGFEKVIKSQRRMSISKEMLNGNFDHKSGEWNLYVDLIK